MKNVAFDLTAFKDTYGYDEVVLLLDQDDSDGRPTREGIVECEDGNETDGLDEGLRHIIDACDKSLDAEV
ncbi:hypothetical protein EIP86_005340 [Pleurotus ostreatoroseus]|nr:hypothetical protein EIP86_005340 [Pleurotus ostreatoroseus]